MTEDIQDISSLARPGSVHYMEAPALRRGLRVPARVKLIILALGFVGLLCASFFGLRAYDSVVNGPIRYTESIRENIENGPGLQLPTLSAYIESDADAIRAAFKEANYQLIDANALFAEEGEDTDEGNLDLVKIPSDMDLSLATDLFKKSLRRVPVPDAAHYLAGSWRFTSISSSGVDFKVKYADFSSDTIETAISNAIAAQGWTDSDLGESGIDEAGNTFQEGTIEINGTRYRWTVSACPLSDVYSIRGLPENAFYIGSRLVS